MARQRPLRAAGCRRGRRRAARRRARAAATKLRRRRAARAPRSRRRGGLHRVDEEVRDVDAVERLVEPRAGDRVAAARRAASARAHARRIAGEAAQLVAGGDQRGRERGADRAAGAGEEDAHGRTIVADGAAAQTQGTGTRAAPRASYLTTSPAAPATSRRSPSNEAAWRQAVDPPARDGRRQHRRSVVHAARRELAAADRCSRRWPPSGCCTPTASSAAARAAGAAGQRLLPVLARDDRPRGGRGGRVRAAVVSALRRPATATHSARVLARAAEHGYRAVVLTVDLPVPGRRERELRHGDVHVPDGVALTSHLGDDLRGATKPLGGWDATLTWADVAWVPRACGLPVLVKGVLTRRGRARRGRRRRRRRSSSPTTAGASSTACVPTAVALREVVAEVAGRVPVLVDGGIRDGARRAARARARRRRGARRAPLRVGARDRRRGRACARCSTRSPPTSRRAWRSRAARRSRDIDAPTACSLPAGDDNSSRNERERGRAGGRDLLARGLLREGIRNVRQLRTGRARKTVTSGNARRDPLSAARPHGGMAPVEGIDEGRSGQHGEGEASEEGVMRGLLLPLQPAVRAGARRAVRDLPARTARTGCARRSSCASPSARSGARRPRGRSPARRSRPRCTRPDAQRRATAVPRHA